MATLSSRKTLSHIERTATEPRDSALHSVILHQINQINPRIRLLRLSPAASNKNNKPFSFLPGQWLDVHVPTISKAGGFTITSPPSLLSSSNPNPYLELAIQKSPDNPAAAWLWRPEGEIIGSEQTVRVGGSFVWPPKIYGREKESPKSLKSLKRVVFVAGGVGINPLMSILSHISQQDQDRDHSLPFEVKFLYMTRDPEEGEERSGDSILFLERLVQIFKRLGREESLRIFLTGGGRHAEGIIACNGNGNEVVKFQGRRIAKSDLLEVLGPPEQRGETVVYICGVPGMTDDFVKAAKEAEGMDARHVLCEKWW